MQVNVMKRLGEWLENPCSATHSRLVREMAAFNEALDDMGLLVNLFTTSRTGFLRITSASILS